MIAHFIFIPPTFIHVIVVVIVIVIVIVIITVVAVVNCDDAVIAVAVVNVRWQAMDEQRFRD